MTLEAGLRYQAKLRTNENRDGTEVPFHKTHPSV